MERRHIAVNQEAQNTKEQLAIDQSGHSDDEQDSNRDGHVEGDAAPQVSREKSMTQHETTRPDGTKHNQPMQKPGAFGSKLVEPSETCIMERAINNTSSLTHENGPARKFAHIDAITQEPNNARLKISHASK